MSYKPFVRGFESQNGRNTELRRYTNTVIRGSGNQQEDEGQVEQLIQKLEAMPKYNTVRMTFYETPIQVGGRTINPIDALKFRAMSKTDMYNTLKSAIEADLSSVDIRGPDGAWAKEVVEFVQENLTP